METYPDENVQPGFAIGFEIDNIYVSLGTMVRILKSVDGITEVKKRRLFSKWEDAHIWFKYLNHECVVVEPFGDSSRYWIGSMNSEERFDISKVEDAFMQYQPPVIVRIFGDLVTLNFKQLYKLVKGRGEKRKRKGKRKRKRKRV